MSEDPAKIENVDFTDARAGACPPPAGIAKTERHVFCGAIDMRIDSQGIWHYRGSPINRHRLVKLFSTVVRRDTDGIYWLITPVEMARIEVEDAPFLAVEMTDTNDNGVRTLSFRTNVDTWVSADKDHPIRIAENPETGEPRPYLRLKADGTEARINRSVFYELVELAEETDIKGQKMLCVESAGEAFVLGPAAEET